MKAVTEMTEFGWLLAVNTRYLSTTLFISGGFDKVGRNKELEKVSDYLS